MGVIMKKSNMLLLAAVGGSVAFFVFQVLANQLPSSFIAQSFNSLGMLYGTLLFTTGLFAVLTALKKSSSSSSQGESKLAWAIGLPMLIGAIGVIHGYFSLMPLPADFPKDIPVPHGTIWSTAVVGVFFSAASAMILFSGRHRRQDSANLTT